MQSRDHWEGVYARKRPDEVSWYRSHLEQSLRFIDAAAPSRQASIIDVGGGASTLVDDLLARGYADVTILDLSAAALEAAKARLGAQAARVRWLTGDITQIDLPPAVYDLWHDRAVFHFLGDGEARGRYLAAVRRALRPGGHILIATFGPEGPTRCSGLDVTRYTADQLRAVLGNDFERVDSAIEVHTTPSGAPQQFVYCLCRLTRP